jgi:hypothetical protein
MERVVDERGDPRLRPRVFCTDYRHSNHMEALGEFRLYGSGFFCMASLRETFAELVPSEDIYVYTISDPEPEPFFPDTDEKTPRCHYRQ